MKLSPALAYLAANPWAMEFGLYGRLADILAAHAAGDRADPEAVAAIKAAAGSPATAPAEPGVQWIGRTAVVPIRGAIARYASSVNGFCQPQGRSAEAIQADLLAAAERGPDRIILRIDSPGGEVAGTAETAALVRHISGSGIPVIAYVDGLCASAAYWIASQADDIVASSATAQVGSIGVATTVRGGDGRNTVITSAPGKAGQPLNDAHLANAKAIVCDLATAFADAVAAGRGLDAAQAAALATGEVWTAARAVELGLVNRLATWDELIRGAAAAADPDAATRRKAIAETIAARITVSKPATASAAAIEPTPAAAAATAQESSMDAKIMAALTALSDKHPNIANALIKEAGKAGATAEGLEAFATAAAAAADAAAKYAAVVTERDALKARAEAAEAKAATAETAKTKAEAELARAKGHAAPSDPGGDEETKSVRKIPTAQAGSLTKQDWDDIKAGKAAFA